jgi:hypothetical protein
LDLSTGLLTKQADFPRQNVLDKKSIYSVVSDCK